MNTGRSPVPYYYYGSPPPDYRPTAFAVARLTADGALDRTFALLTQRLRSLCYSPDFTRTEGNSPAALGNRIAAAAINAGRHDGSLESLHYVDAGYVPGTVAVVARPRKA